MSSTNFTYQDAVDAARELLNDDAAHRWADADIQLRFLPRVLQQLRADRPDAFLGTFTAPLNLKPSLASPCAFEDEVFTAFVEALVAAIDASDDESTGNQSSQLADARSERARSK